MLQNKIKNKQSGILLYGLTPPKIDINESKIISIAKKQINRLQNINLDGLILYDIQDESSRTDTPRPFPFSPTLSPDVYSKNYLQALNIPKIIYKSVVKYTPIELEKWITENEKEIGLSVFVGSPSKTQQNNLSLVQAYEIKKSTHSPILLGGVTIPERHAKKGDEHIRIIQKNEKGCTFFVSQCVYSINNTKDFLSDYYYYCTENNIEMVPIIFTLTPCGSLKTLQFMEWLGVEIPKWLKNDLQHSTNILEQSVELCKTIAHEIIEYCKPKNIPFGFNIESVAIRKEEIDASIELLAYLEQLLKKSLD
jgi:hypothetical protein